MPSVPADTVELVMLRLPLRTPFATAHGTTVTRDVLLVRVLLDGVEGWGECAAGTDTSYWHETVESCAAALRAAVTDGEDLAAAPMAAAALDAATTDARYRSAGTSIAMALGGGEPPALRVTATAGFEDRVEDLLGAGYRSVKLKFGTGRTLDEVTSLVRAHPDIRWQIDANGGLDPECDRATLHALDALGLDAIEQPLALTASLDAHVALARRLRTPVALDESLDSPEACRAALRAGAMGLAVVKPSRLGGLGPALATGDSCAAAGVPAKVGGMLETGIGRAAALALACAAPFSFPPDLSASARYWAKEVITEPFELDRDGCLRARNGPGFGVAVDRAVIDAHTVHRETLRTGH